MGLAECTTLLVDTVTVCPGVGTSTYGAKKEFSDLATSVEEQRRDPAFWTRQDLLTVNCVIIVQCDAATVVDFWQS